MILSSRCGLALARGGGNPRVSPRCFGTGVVELRLQTRSSDRVAWPSGRASSGDGTVILDGFCLFSSENALAALASAGQPHSASVGCLRICSSEQPVESVTFGPRKAEGRSLALGLRLRVQRRGMASAIGVDGSLGFRLAFLAPCFARGEHAGCSGFRTCPCQCLRAAGGTTSVVTGASRKLSGPEAQGSIGHSSVATSADRYGLLGGSNP